ncbi:MAG: hypothetical protein ACKOAY_00730 [Haliscomenobacter sp.]
MLNKLMQSLREATEALKEEATQMGEGAREKTEKVINDWLQIFPKLQQFGLQVNSFALQVALSPAVEVELLGHHNDFSPEKLDAILQQCKGNTALSSVFTAIKTTYSLQARTKLGLSEPLIVRIRIKLSPEIKVFLGKPILD